MANLYVYTPVIEDKFGDPMVIMKRDDKYGTYIHKHDLEEWLKQQDYNFVSAKEAIKNLCEELGINYG